MTTRSDDQKAQECAEAFKPLADAAATIMQRGRPSRDSLKDACRNLLRTIETETVALEWAGRDVSFAEIIDARIGAEFLKDIRSMLALADDLS